MNKIYVNLRMFLWMSVLTGIIYPVLITVLAQLTMKMQADGDFISSSEKVVGARLIAQKFESDKYFWGRPSANDYNPLVSGGSNLGPTSKVLQKTVSDRKEQILKSHTVKADKIPSELLFASGSGLDPHINISTAYFQIDRIAKVRGLNKEEIKNLVDRMLVGPRLGFLGVTCVNVLLLNQALDNLPKP